MAKVKDAEVIVYATPIYYYEMCAQIRASSLAGGMPVW
jgi:multimeric flavodoxin WrbA